MVISFSESKRFMFHGSSAILQATRNMEHGTRFKAIQGNFSR